MLSDSPGNEQNLIRKAGWIEFSILQTPVPAYLTEPGFAYQLHESSRMAVIGAFGNVKRASPIR